MGGERLLLAWGSNLRPGPVARWPTLDRRPLDFAKPGGKE
jgi:hypothetical protein